LGGGKEDEDMRWGREDRPEKRRRGM